MPPVLTGGFLFEFELDFSQTLAKAFLYKFVYLQLKLEAI